MLLLVRATTCVRSVPNTNPVDIGSIRMDVDMTATLFTSILIWIQVATTKNVEKTNLQLNFINVHVMSCLFMPYTTRTIEECHQSINVMNTLIDLYCYYLFILMTVRMFWNATVIQRHWIFLVEQSQWSTTVFPERKQPITSQLFP